MFAPQTVRKTPAPSPRVLSQSHMKRLRLARAVSPAQPEPARSEAQQAAVAVQELRTGESVYRTRAARTGGLALRLCAPLGLNIPERAEATTGEAAPVRREEASSPRPVSTTLCSRVGRSQVLQYGTYRTVSCAG